jgi:hypothetical protein
MKKNTIAGPGIARGENALKAILFVAQEPELIKVTQAPEPSGIGEIISSRQSIRELVAVE